MTIAYVFMMFSLFIPLGSAAYAKLTTKGYDNHAPREFLAALQGKGQRANYAQQNFYETFPAFAAALIIAHQLGAEQTYIDILAIVYFTMRVGYAYFYIQDKHILRSVSWFLAFGSIIGLFIISF